MKKIILKIFVFIVVFYVLCVAVAFLLKDYQGSRSCARVLMHELYNQGNIDILYCGASHVSHGITPVIADKMTGKNNFSTGTSGQSIKGTYAILRQATKLYNIEKVFLELDFAVATKPSRTEQSGFKADYIVSQYIKDPFIKFDYLFSISTPKYYLNHILPIGKDKYMTLRPQSLVLKAKSFFDGSYFSYEYKDTDDEYDGKGCLLDVRPVKNGTFVNTVYEKPISIESISDDWKNTIDKIIILCKEKNIELIFYSQPCTDYYLAEKGNYDDYYTFAKDFCNARGFEYYDFNLAKEKYQLLEDSDFHDDNHFSKQGVYKWTKIFWDYFLGNIQKDDMFHDSYAEKIAIQEDRIYGLVLKESEDKKSILITPIKNHVDPSRITYDIYIILDGKEMLLRQNTKETTIELPPNKSGTCRVISYIDNKKQTDCKTHFTSF